jgi:beta-galactosidase
LTYTGQVRAQFQGDPVDMVADEKSVHFTSGSTRDVRFWSTNDPYLYMVYTILTANLFVLFVVRLR